MGKLIDLTGKIYGRLTVISLAEKRNSYHYWLCQCSCGIKKEIEGSCLRGGKVKSCGCFQRENMSKIKKTHGFTTLGSKIPKEYKTWIHIKRRCYYIKDKDYKYYGARGIKVCERWLNSYVDFLSDMGPADSPEYSIDRIKNDGDYEPGNCKWSTTLEQNRNKRRKGTALKY